MQFGTGVRLLFAGVGIEREPSVWLRVCDGAVFIRGMEGGCACGSGRSGRQ